MAMNPHSLRPSELARILNSSELGEVVSRDRITQIMNLRLHAPDIQEKFPPGFARPTGL